jgi:pyruvate ferredoxin oxidoreductase alpha subunit
MLKQTEGSHAVAEAVALCRPDVICAYPISPQTHIVEGLGELVKDGSLTPCEFINVESEFAAMSVAIGASSRRCPHLHRHGQPGSAVHGRGGVQRIGPGPAHCDDDCQPRHWCAHQHLERPFRLHEPARLRLDSAVCREQSRGVDLHIQAFKLAEELSMPVMVCMDGFILTHAFERVDIPEQAQVDVFLPPYEPRQVLDTAEPVSIGAMVGPEAFMEVRYLAHAKQLMALDVIPRIAAEFKAQFGRESGGLVRGYRTEDAETIVVALGSVIGTLKDVVDEMREQGLSIGVLGIQSFRPFPLSAVREALQKAKRVVVLEKSFSVGLGGVVSTDVRLALSGLHVHGYTVVAGLGGRSITKASLHRTLREAIADTLQPLTFMDLDWGIVNRQLEREAQMRRSGPIAENLLRDVGAVASKVN